MKVWAYVSVVGSLWMLPLAPPLSAQPPREQYLFDDGWRFHLGDVPEAESPEMMDGSWRQVRLPHDWSIEGTFSPEYASGTGFLPGGIGWYRKTFQLSESIRDGRISVRFDGVYRNSTVWINGERLGFRPFGYSTFEYDLTPYLHFGPTPNVLAVRVEREIVADSRWYTGSGIYRHVWLTVVEPLHMAPWGVFVTTPLVNEAEALVTVETRILNQGSDEADTRVSISILNPGGEEVGRVESRGEIAPGKERTFVEQAEVDRPALWSPGEPHLYTAVTQVYREGRLVDEKWTHFGIRSFRFDPDLGLIFNGQPLKVKGVCLHHDLGVLGAGFFEEALARRLRSLKAIGVNALRTAHNPMAPEFYDLADRMGFLVMDEAFDEWIGGKRKWAEGWNVGVAERRGYHEYFEEWSVLDLQAMVLRDRNHPSIILWSLGNEIDYPGDPFVHPRGRGGNSGLRPELSANLMVPIARQLMAAVKELDTSRPVTMGLADIDASNATGVANMLDVVGYNYQEQDYARDHQRYPDRVMYGSENSRGLDAWRSVALNDYVAGQFVWTGVSYLGEARRWPLHGSNSGLLDLQGFWKPEAYLRQALWSEEPMVYAVAWGPEADGSRMADWPEVLGRMPTVERWGWTDDPRPTIPLEIYSNCDSVEVLLNARSLGVRAIGDPLLPAMIWEVPNEPGEVEVLGHKDGNVVAEFQLKTVGQPASLELRPDLTAIESGGRQVATIEVRVLDEHGNWIPDADVAVRAEVSGQGILVGLGTADPADTTRFTAEEVHLYQGRAVAVVRSGADPGRLTLRVTALEVRSAETTIEVRGEPGLPLVLR